MCVWAKSISLQQIKTVPAEKGSCNWVLFHVNWYQWQMPVIYNKSADCQSQARISVAYINYFNCSLIATLMKQGPEQWLWVSWFSLQHKDWDAHTLQLTGFIRTKAWPHVYYKPARWTLGTEKLLRETKIFLNCEFPFSCLFTVTVLRGVWVGGVLSRA